MVPLCVDAVVGFGRVVHVGRQMDAGDRAVDRVGVLVVGWWWAEQGDEDSLWPVGCAWEGSGVAGVPLIVVLAAGDVA